MVGFDLWEHIYFATRVEEKRNIWPIWRDSQRTEDKSLFRKQGIVLGVQTREISRALGWIEASSRLSHWRFELFASRGLIVSINDSWFFFLSFLFPFLCPFLHLVTKLHSHESNTTPPQQWSTSSSSITSISQMIKTQISLPLRTDFINQTTTSLTECPTANNSCNLISRSCTTQALPLVGPECHYSYEHMLIWLHPFTTRPTFCYRFAAESAV